MKSAVIAAPRLVTLGGQPAEKFREDENGMGKEPSHSACSPQGCTSKSSKVGLLTHRLNRYRDSQFLRLPQQS